MRIIVLEDDPDQQALIAACLERDGHQLVAAHCSAELKQVMQLAPCDMLILDWQLPDASGVEVLKYLRHVQNWRQPVLFITARRQQGDAVTALEAGADDFLHKPLDLGELRARVRALERRLPQFAVAYEVTLGHYRLCRRTRSVTAGSEEVALTEREYQLLDLFFSHPGQLLSRRFLMETVWGLSGDVQTRTLDTHISRLRRKLALNGSNGLRLRSIYQYGYRLEGDAIAAPPGKDDDSRSDDAGDDAAS